MKSKQLRFNDLHEVISFIYKSYGLQEDKVLTPQAKSLKDAINLVVKDAESFLPNIREILLK